MLLGPLIVGMTVELPTLDHRPGRFSLATLLLIMTTLVCACGWIAAQRKAQRAGMMVQTLHREVEFYRDKMAQIEVVDETKVHALGLPRSGWLMYFPPGKYVVHGYIGARGDHGLQGPFPPAPLLPPLELAGEMQFEAKLSHDTGAGDWTVEFSKAGQTVRKRVPWKLKPEEIALDGFAIAPGQRAVWEPGEAIVLMARRPVSTKTEEPAAMVAIWVEQLSRDAEEPKEAGAK